QHPPQPPQSEDLLFLLSVQDIGHAHGAYKPPRESMSRTPLSLAGFQVILIGRFWVIAEVSARAVLTSNVHANRIASAAKRLRRWRWFKTGVSVASAWISCVFMTTSLWSFGCGDDLSRDRRRLLCGQVAHRRETEFTDPVQIRAKCVLIGLRGQCTSGDLWVIYR